MTDSENPEPWDFDNLPEGAKRIVNNYTQVWYTKSKKISGNLWKDLEDSDFSELEDVPEDPPTYCEEIIREMMDAKLIGMERSDLATLGRVVQTELARRWSSLITEHLQEEGDASCAGLLKAVERFNERGQPEDLAVAFLKELRDGNNPRECLMVLKSRGLCDDEAESIPDDFYPFQSRFFGDESGKLTWHRFSNTMKHVSESLSGRVVQGIKPEDHIDTLNLFFFSPALGKMDPSIYESEISKALDFIQPGSGQYLVALMEKTTKVTKSAFHSAEYLEKRLDVVTWKEWVNPYDGGSPFRELCAALENNPVVEIYGNGGLGKTHLARHFTKQNIIDNCTWKTTRNNEKKIDRFETIIWIPSKKEKEWGAWRVGDGDVRDPRLGIGLRNENADYGFFLRQILLHKERDGPSFGYNQETDRALDILKEKRMLIVIDNFEDIKRDGSTLQHFIEFFGDIRTGTRSKIIITGREENSRDVPSAQGLELRSFDTSRVQELISKTFVEMARAKDKGEIDWRYSSQALEYLTSNPENIGDFMKKLEENNTEKFVRELGKPYNIFEYTRLIGEKSYEMRGENLNSERFREVVMDAAAADAKLQQFIEKKRKDSAKDAYTQLLRDPRCKEILLALYKNSGKALNADQIRVHVNNSGNIPSLSINDFDDALRRIRTYEDLIEPRNDTGESQTGTAWILAAVSIDILRDNDDFPSEIEVSEPGLIPAVSEMLYQIQWSIENCIQSGGKASYSQPSPNTKEKKNRNIVASIGVGTAIKKLKEYEGSSPVDRLRHGKIRIEELSEICKFLELPYSNKSREELEQAIVQKSDIMPISCMDLSIAIGCIETLLSDEIDVSEVEEMSEWLEDWIWNQIRLLVKKPERAEEEDLDRIATLCLDLAELFEKLERFSDSKQVILESVDLFDKSMSQAHQTKTSWQDRLSALISSPPMQPVGGI